MIKYFTSSMIFTIVALALVGVYGMTIGGAEMALRLLTVAAMLGILETSLSFDNAIVNAKQLGTMSAKWRHRFITWGMVIAVFGMRVVFPILIVYFASSLTFIESIILPFTDVHKYEALLKSAEIAIAGFGGSFLLLIGLEFFLDSKKEVHWLKYIEPALSRLGYKGATTIIALVTVTILTKLLPTADQITFIVAAISGIVIHQMIDLLSDIFGMDGADTTQTVAKQGIIGFLYLEILDASFSLDGVIGAFALSNNIVVITMGLGIGAMFVRSFTLMLVDKGTISEYRYLESGAFWSIMGLAVLIFTGMFMHISELVSGSVAMILIIAAFVHSVFENKKDKLAEVKLTEAVEG